MDQQMSRRPASQLRRPRAAPRTAHLDEMVAHCLSAYPEEGCGLITGDPATRRRRRACIRTRNVAASAQLYTVDPSEHLRIDRAAEAAGQAVIGVFHSHTHTDPYPVANRRPAGAGSRLALRARFVAPRGGLGPLVPNRRRAHHGGIDRGRAALVSD